MAFRFFALTLFFGLLYAGLGFNLYRLQVEKGDYYIQKVQARSEALATLLLRRGQVFFTDRYGKDIAIAQNRDYPLIFAVPKEIEDPEGAAKILAPLFGKEVAELSETLENRKSLFKPLQEKATPEQLEVLRQLNMQGIDWGEKQYRFYPFLNLAAHLVGLVGVNETHEEPLGLYGIEKYSNDILAEGNDVRLTIDLNLQAESEEVLEKLISKFNAQGGTVMIQEPMTGKILALANKPDFNPNEYSRFPIADFPNVAVQNVYEPGSVFKPFTMAAGIDAGILTPETTYIDTGSVTLNGKTIRNWDKKAHGKITMTNVIEQSVNTGAIYAEQKIGHIRFTEYLERFGFGEKTGIDLPDEVRGSLKNLKRKEARAVDFATASFGQGTSVTPVQLVTAFSSFANGGLLMRPYVSRKADPYVVRRVISGDTAEKITHMLESAVQKAGVAAIPLYRVAGKTGTAFVPDFLQGGYTEELIHTYVGFAPASNPKFTLLIKLEKPKYVELAGITVVPAFREISEFILNYYNIPPDLSPRIVSSSSVSR